MTLASLQDASHAIGAKQVSKAVKRGQAELVFLAEDADAHITMPLKKLCAEQQVPCEMAESMQALGKACGIRVGAAAAAVLR